MNIIIAYEFLRTICLPFHLFGSFNFIFSLHFFYLFCVACLLWRFSSYFAMNKFFLMKENCNAFLSDRHFSIRLFEFISKTFCVVIVAKCQFSRKRRAPRTPKKNTYLDKNFPNGKHDNDILYVIKYIIDIKKGFFLFLAHFICIRIIKSISMDFSCGSVPFCYVVFFFTFFCFGQCLGPECKWCSESGRKEENAAIGAVSHI